ncbi:Tat pathway signal sequence [Limosilactobacillus sp. STM2_1]|uniref:Tat pathway signal sequence n=1 Tax=Limosilactobacillus rudii TaxID=2759755 RepID=A0A7W3YPM0_9LACO|nr:Tat pathway signal sequence [Limosilactobacillus rudii]MBB1079284.1 Tat pathway signal sequence [Limosilactobacillus rudii]MBB1098522.1 Tat pathway signal sequence [Limosilactobacillus rudii]MCD7135531.1 Tat pathway signal sequence [Limosilactobacillus rudii]
MYQFKRILMGFCGVTLCGLCVGMLQKANLGVDPFTCFVTGIANIFGSTYSTFYLILTGILLFLVFILRRHYIGIATIINLLFTGVTADIMREFLNNAIPHPSLVIRWGLMLIAIVFTCLAAALYFTADLGVSAYDAIALIAAYKYRLLPFKYCRIITDSICVIIGFAFNVTLGIGTVITALFMGPLTQWFKVHIAEPLLSRNQLIKTA